MGICQSWELKLMSIRMSSHGLVMFFLKKKYIQYLRAEDQMMVRCYLVMK